ncbi:MAG: dihydroxyacetone kinase phosphoryl donor subunit DhaM, partial [Arthrobacter sp.]
MTVRLVVVSHSEKIADGAVEVAAQMAPDVLILPAGGTDDGRIGTSLERVMAALEQAADANSDGTVVLTDLGSAVMTAESGLEFLADPSSVLLADAPLVEGLVAAAVAAQAGADAAGVKEAAEAVYRPPAPPQHAHEHRPPEAAGDFTLVNQAGMHARPAAKIAGGLSGMDAEVTVNGADGA